MKKYIILMLVLLLSACSHPTKILRTNLGATLPIMVDVIYDNDISDVWDSVFVYASQNYNVFETSQSLKFIKFDIAMPQDSIICDRIDIQDNNNLYSIKPIDVGPYRYTILRENHRDTYLVKNTINASVLINFFSVNDHKTIVKISVKYKILNYGEIRSTEVKNLILRQFKHNYTFFKKGNMKLGAFNVTCSSNGVIEQQIKMELERINIINQQQKILRPTIPNVINIEAPINNITIDINSGK